MENEKQMVISMPPIQEDEELLEDGSTDSQGNIALRSKTGGWRTALLILGPETCEKMAVGGIVINLVPYLVGKLHLSSSYAANMVTTYQGTSYMFTLLGGFIADAFLGRFQVITGASIVTFFGLLMLTLSATLAIFKPTPCIPDSLTDCTVQDGAPLIVVYFSLYLIALGTGGIKSSAAAFGADQFDPNHQEEKKNLAGFFSWYFFGISLGSLFAVTVLVWMQDNVGREWGYLVPTVAILIVVITFISGRPLFRYKAPKGSPLTLIAQVLVAAYKKRKLTPPPDPDMLYELSEKNRPHDNLMRVKHSDQFKFLDKAAIMEDSNKPVSENPWLLCTVTSVEETKMVIRLMPILITTSLFYTVYAQMTTFSVEQGNTMRRRFGSSFQFPAASMGAFLQCAILLTIYMWEKAFVPVARRFTGNEKGITSLQRISVGLVISIITMIVAGVIEKQRLKHIQLQQSDLEPRGVVNMSIFWLLPQYILVGSGEALTYAGQLDFFYNESPRAMRSMGSALCVCTLSIGYYTSSLLVSLVNSITGHKHDASNGSISDHHGAWLPDNINNGRLDLFYWLLAGVSTTNFFLFLACAHWYKYKAVDSPLEQFSEEKPEDEFETVDLDTSNTKNHQKAGGDVALKDLAVSTAVDGHNSECKVNEMRVMGNPSPVLGVQPQKHFESPTSMDFHGAGELEHPHHSRSSSFGDSGEANCHHSHRSHSRSSSLGDSGEANYRHPHHHRRTPSRPRSTSQSPDYEYMFSRYPSFV